MTEMTLHARKYSKREVKEALGWDIGCKCVLFFFKLGPVLVLLLPMKCRQLPDLNSISLLYRFCTLRVFLRM